MKISLSILTTTILCLGLTPTFAQFGRTPSGPKFDGATAKLFGEHLTFSAAMEFQNQPKAGELTSMPGKIVFDSGKSRFEMNLSEAKGMKMPPNGIEHMKEMGMDTMVSISRPDKKLIYVVYPGMHSYVEMAAPDRSANTDSADYKVETKEIGRETVEGHDCVKNKVTVTDKDNTKHESIVWSATDLQDFPVKIVTNDQGQDTTMLFKKISFAKPAESSFEAPADFTKYTSMQTMMQNEMMKKMGGGMGMPSGQ